MDFIFGDDASQVRPYRSGMGPLVAIGGIYVPGKSVRELETRVDVLCTEHGFPLGEVFKWSPHKDQWMHDNLVLEKRQEFFTKVLTLAEEFGVETICAVEDCNCKRATKAPNAQLDVTQLFLERVHRELCRKQSEGVVIIARPSGGRGDEDEFLAECVDTLQKGTKYIKPDRIALNILSSPSRFVRLLQVADIIASCTTATVAGESKFAPPIFDLVRRLFAKDGNRTGGIGFKLHPDLKYGNLYHWLVGDTHIWKGCVGYPLPYPHLPYSTSPHVP